MVERVKTHLRVYSVNTPNASILNELKNLRYHQFLTHSRLSMARIRLIRKLALSMNGVDVSGLKVGDIIELDDERADMMVELGWAERAGKVTSSDAAAASQPQRNHSAPR